ncbi:pyrroloquinoline quinone biosynthesis protein PqqB [Amaricoccus solimangrovi]|uniref:Coenzyme PQQ synthesis protein B n=1 Tax=Amaricoccus solimangrovi TaxID=2589815 RepID=A0A501WRZ5_9RHOB|nr:pyrroloquinoline quinone biosynthesis protein PqqB [Amaricoccus solimangrovi]TPE52513.1 pyrroloquinoline quinone biosynthesis protein PqqB [Amaricoccus solimangrovi]
MFRARILGAAAGGGLPQWNCGCDNCRAARRGEIPSLTQSSLAVSGDGVGWAILNASPDIRAQLAATPELHPTGLREVPIRSVLLTNGDIDHVAGLLTLREQQPFTLFATPEILAVIAANPIFDALAPGKVSRSPLPLDVEREIAPGLTAELFAVPGKVPLYMEGAEAEVRTDLLGENTVGAHLRAGGEDVFYIPGCARVTPELAARIDGAAALFFDGTLWRDDEMVRTGVGTKTGKRMGHISMSGPEGSIAALAPLAIGRRVFVHMNNTNPVLRPGSAERSEAERQGWTIGRDGMEITP